MPTTPATTLPLCTPTRIWTEGSSQTRGNVRNIANAASTQLITFCCGDLGLGQPDTT